MKKAESSKKQTKEKKSIKFITPIEALDTESVDFEPIKSIDKHIGNRIRLRRVMLDITQERMANALGISFQQFQKYERGLNRISIARLYFIAQILEAPVEYFFKDFQQPLDFKKVLKKSTALLFKEAPDSVDDSFFYSKEILELLRCFSKIKNAELKKHLLLLFKTLAEENQNSISS